MFKLNLKIALRNLWKNKGFSLINIGGLAIGLTCSLMLLLYVNYEWSFDKQLKNFDKIYLAKLNLKFNGNIATTGAVPYKLTGAVMEEIPGIKRASRFYVHHGSKLFSKGENKFKLKSLYVDPSFIQILRYNFLYGNEGSALSKPNSLILTASTAKKLFGTENPIGKSVKWDNLKELQVTGVIEDLPKNQSIQFEILQPWAFFEQIDSSVKTSGWGSIDCAALFELKDNASVEQINGLLKNFVVNKEPELKSYIYEPFLFPLSKIHLYSQFENGKVVGGGIDQVKLFAFLALCVLLVACINYMNLSTARSEKRAREVGVRKALGSSRQTIMGQFILESLMLSLFSMMIAFALVEVSLPYFNNLLAVTIEINYSSYLFWTVIIGLILITGLLAGSYPAFYLSSFIPVKVLKGFKGSIGTLSFRRALVVLQFSLSVCMIISAIVVYNQIQFLKNRPLGFDQNNMVQLDLEGAFKDPSKTEIFKKELLQAGAIVAASEFASPFTEGGTITGDVSWPGKPATDRSIINYRSTGFAFTNTIGAKVLAGRDFSPQFSADTNTSVLLNESAVKLMNLKKPVGTIIHWDNEPLKIVGVIQDYFSERLGKIGEPTLFYYNVKTSGVLLLRLNPNQSLTTSIEQIKRSTQKFNSAYPAEITFVSEGMQTKLQSERLLSILSNVFGGFAIFISCLGLLGLALYMAEQRSKEISIRKVLGAGLSDILVLLNKDFMKLVVIANVIAIPIAYILMTNWLKKYDYKIDVNYLPFLLAVVASILIALLTVSLQTFKVAKANAVDALKYE
ncbi:ABC transporter permease [Pedobacter insulae]|uniref:ABC-type transport system, involved in lipoprotein release, permease component n=1 Tax=Pedobacter insulae TaxID=414048 RepID=A0A1I2WJW7_9SPHI|nr:ABC transporter permease [Pedobacter insulae]SFH01608.1 ABC-type transport system, involved in lipoprotein release, permease component [Pedobacter insulae]